MTKKIALLAFVAACHAAPGYSTVPLGPGSGNASFDYIAYESTHQRIWIPYSRQAGFVDVYDIGTQAMTHLGGFGIREAAADDGRKRVLGPSAVAIGDGVAYIGDRGTSQICPVEAATLKPLPCVGLPAAPDSVTYVPSTKEIWITAPKTNAIVVLDATNPSAPVPKTTIALDGGPEGYALDEAHGVFLTNLEDKNRTLRIGLTSHAVESTWEPGCSADGPRGLRADPVHGFVIVACTDRIQVLDAGGKSVGTLDTGAGVDDFAFAGNRLYIAASKAGRMTIAELDPAGKPSVVATVALPARTRNAVVDDHGVVYAVDPAGPRLVVIPAR